MIEEGEIIEIPVENFAGKSVSILFQKKANILMVEQEN